MGAFFRAVLIGTLAGATPPLLITIPLALISLDDGGFNGTLLSSLMIGIAPLLVTFPIVLACCLCVGLPAVAILRRCKRESASNYVALGCIGGGIVPIILLWIMSTPDMWEPTSNVWWLALLGTFSGGVTATSWARGIGLIAAE